MTSYKADDLGVNMVSGMHLVSQKWAMHGNDGMTTNNIRLTPGRRSVAQINPVIMRHI